MHLRAIKIRRTDVFNVSVTFHAIAYPSYLDELFFFMCGKESAFTVCGERTLTMSDATTGAIEASTMEKLLATNSFSVVYSARIRHPIASNRSHFWSHARCTAIS
ncbi:unnamed protein product [Toxocara canis]|uniref:4-hydroxybenzoyl-CoA thioesterase n=1 Tax=Toxocara canis TaxID=6265 RepID=A0A183UK68_TOXCA|nr:unnamed protein product [Toxocara canis]